MLACTQNAASCPKTEYLQVKARSCMGYTGWNMKSITPLAFWETQCGGRGGASGTKEAILESNCCFNSSYLQNQEKCHALEINELQSAAVCTV